MVRFSLRRKKQNRLARDKLVEAALDPGDFSRFSGFLQPFGALFESGRCERRSRAGSETIAHIRLVWGKTVSLLRYHAIKSDS